jgi:hypothetical protein
LGVFSKFTLAVFRAVAQLWIVRLYYTTMKSKLPDFTSKMVSVLSVGEDTPCLIGDAHFEMQAGRLFLVGIVPRGGSAGDWVAGLPSAVAWDTVQEYIVFDSAEDYVKRVTIYDKKKKSRKA